MNQNPEQLARDEIDAALVQGGGSCKGKFHQSSGGFRSCCLGIKLQCPAECVLFVDAKPVGLIEAKREEEAVRLTMHKDQSTEYTNAN